MKALFRFTQATLAVHGALGNMGLEVLAPLAHLTDRGHGHGRGAAETVALGATALHEIANGVGPGRFATEVCE